MVQKIGNLSKILLKNICCLNVYKKEPLGKIIELFRFFIKKKGGRDQENCLFEVLEEFGRGSPGAQE